MYIYITSFLQKCKKGHFRENVVKKFKFRFRPKIIDLTGEKFFGKGPDHKECDFTLYFAFLHTKLHIGIYITKNPQKIVKKSIFFGFLKNAPEVPQIS